jgi:hypothetical protein
MDRVYAEELLSDTEWLQDQAEKAGIGFEIPSALLGVHGLRSEARQEGSFAT